MGLDDLHDTTSLKTAGSPIDDMSTTTALLGVGAVAALGFVGFAAYRALEPKEPVFDGFWDSARELVWPDDVATKKLKAEADSTADPEYRAFLRALAKRRDMPYAARAEAVMEDMAKAGFGSPSAKGRTAHGLVMFAQRYPELTDEYLRRLEASPYRRKENRT